jgi:16S rRNA (uracil1498-N3)-methyltransferase
MSSRAYIDGPVVPGHIILHGPEAHHLAVVCRVHPGDQVRLFNGDGREYPATVLQVGRRYIELDVGPGEACPRELDFRLEVAAPLPRGDRGHFLLEKLTELGVTRYTPLRTRRSVAHPAQERAEKLERYVIEASKQCGRNVLMEIAPVTDWLAHCSRVDLPERRILAHPPGPFAAASLPPITASHADQVLAVGPEGGLVSEEVEAARAAGWSIVGLGPRVLRVETAAVVLAALAAFP